MCASHTRLAACVSRAKPVFRSDKSLKLRLSIVNFNDTNEEGDFFARSLFSFRKKGRRGVREETQRRDGRSESRLKS